MGNNKVSIHLSVYPGIMMIGNTCVMQCWTPIIISYLRCLKALASGRPGRQGEKLQFLHHGGPAFLLADLFVSSASDQCQINLAPEEHIALTLKVAVSCQSVEFSKLNALHNIPEWLSAAQHHNDFLICSATLSAGASAFSSTALLL